MKDEKSSRSWSGARKGPLGAKRGGGSSTYESRQVLELHPRLVTFANHNRSYTLLSSSALRSWTTLSSSLTRASAHVQFAMRPFGAGQITITRVLTPAQTSFSFSFSCG